MKISNDSLVEFTYSITDQNNATVEQVDLPVNYIHGRQSGLHDKIERAMEGCRTGDTVKVSLEPEEGFGAKDPSLIITENASNVPEEILNIGAEAEFQNDRGEGKTFRVTKISNGIVTLDGNHPLAGQPVTFTLKILDVRNASQDELAGKIPTGQAAGMPDTQPPTLN